MDIEKMARDEIEEEISRLENELEEIEDRKRELEEALNRCATDDSGMILVGELCVSCHGNDRIKYGLCMECRRKATIMLNSGIEPAKISMGKDVVTRALVMLKLNLPDPQQAVA